MVYYSTLAAADSYYVLINDSETLTIYDYGYNITVNNYLKKSKPSDISVIKLSNSEF